MARLAPPPRSCPYCLFGLCRLCSGRLTVLDVAGRAREVACQHEHPAGARLAPRPPRRVDPNGRLPCGTDSARRRHLAHGQTCAVCGTGAGLLAMAVLTPDDPALPADPGGEPC